MATISTCIIVKNEINNIPELVNDLRQFSEEIIIVDTGSTDGTLEWLEEHKDDVLKLDHFKWIDHFAEARNYSFSKATMDWIFWCDADDRISPELIEEIKNIKKTLNSSPYTGIFINYLFGPDFHVPRRRLLRRSSNPKWQGACHECVMCDEDICTKIRDDAKIIHHRVHPHTDRNLRIFIKNVLKGVEFTSRDLTYYSNELRDAGFMDKSAEIAETAIFRNDMWCTDVWNLMVFNTGPIWAAKPEYAKRGLLFINEYEKVNKLRSDVYWLRGFLCKLLGDIEQAIKDFRRAIQGDPDLIDIELFSCLPSFSEIFPAMELFELTDDEEEKNKCIEIIKKYPDDENVKSFLTDYNLN